MYLNEYNIARTSRQSVDPRNGDGEDEIASEPVEKRDATDEAGRLGHRCNEHQVAQQLRAVLRAGNWRVCADN